MIAGGNNLCKEIKVKLQTRKHSQRIAG